LLEREQENLRVDGDRIGLEVTPFEIVTMIVRPLHGAA
jgi:hypothetical protein